MSQNSSSTKPLQHMFTQVPASYDLVNRVITLGMDRRWRLAALREILSGKPKKILDVGCGTGEMTVQIARMADEDVEVIGFDFSQPMLDIARKRAQKLAPGKKFSFVYGDIAEMPYSDKGFDCISISFAFRNLTYMNPKMKRYLEEILRVLRPGGRFVIIESSQPKSRVIRWFHHQYLRFFVFPAGYIISRNIGAYRYLSLSTRRFYTADEVVELLIKAGFKKVSYCQFFFGAVALHVAEK